MTVEAKATTEETLRAALQAIVDFQPQRYEVAADFQERVDACVGQSSCQFYREIKHPISHFCDKHYRELAAAHDKTKRASNDQWIEMKDIARAALKTDGSASR